MKWRVIIRMSFSSNRGLQYRVTRSLAKCGIRKVKAVGTWEGKSVTAKEAANEFQNIFNLLAGLTREQGLGQLNHLWIYIDQA
jgi:hypothetical protein